jgi:hypothetical protein
MEIRFVEEEEETKREMEAQLEAAKLKDKEERERHAEIRSELLIKYFSEKVSPALHETAARKAGFDEWKEQ